MRFGRASIVRARDARRDIIALAAERETVSVRNPRFQSIVFFVLIAWLVMLPAPVRASCLLSAPESGPQPLAEPCDSVLMSLDGVIVNLITFDVALASLSLTVSAALWLIWCTLRDHAALPDDFSLILDPPPPRLSPA
jgi:hypothetical protein